MTTIAKEQSGSESTFDQQVPIGFLDDLHRSMTKEAVLQTYSYWSRNLIDADRCSVALSEGGDTLRITAMNGTRGVPEGTLQPLSNTVVGQAFVTQKPLCIPNIAALSFPDAKVVSAMGYQSAVVVPIITAGVCFGTLSASFKQTLSTPKLIETMLAAMARCLATQLLLIDKMQELGRIARTDALTGANNRHALREEADDVWSQWSSDNTTFSIISIDLDHFKRINDTLGHDAGDIVLRETVGRLRSATRNRGSIYRLGGEEFGVVCRELCADQAQSIGTEVLHALRSHPIAFDEEQIKVTASMGIASPSVTDISFNDTLKRADQALYQAKSSGRDCLIVAR